MSHKTKTVKTMVKKKNYFGFNNTVFYEDTMYRSTLYGIVK